MRSVNFKPAVSFIFVCLLVLTGPQDLMAGDAQSEPWYRDMSGHWSRPYVHLLWQEGVTDGVVRVTNGKVRSYYKPSDRMSRAQLALLLSKVFACRPLEPELPSYPDLPKGYQALPGKAAWSHIEGLLGSGIVLVQPGSPFRPDDGLTREDSVWFLIGALGLMEVADNLEDSEVDSILRSFRDGLTCSQDRWRAMACAIKYGIVNGYEDDTLRPKRTLTRAEGATIAARSCVIRANANQQFSPDGDGVDDVLSIELGFLKNRGISTWQVSISTQYGLILSNLNQTSATGDPPSRVIWDGTDQEGNSLPEGTYYYQAYVLDNAGRSHVSVKRPVELIRHSLSAKAVPQSVNRGSSFSVLAFANPRPRAVVIRTGGNELPLSPNGGASWIRSLPVEAAGNEQHLVVEAVFEGCVRQVALSVTIIDPMWLIPSVTPERALWGDHLTLSCRASDNVSSVEAMLFGLRTRLLLETAHSPIYTGTALVPQDISPGVYPIVFTGKGDCGTVTEEISLTVASAGLTGVRFILTK